MDQPNDNQTNSAPQSSPAAPAPKHNNTLMGVLAYLGILVIIPWLAAKDEPFVKFHVKQGLVLVCISIIIWIVGSVVWRLWPILHIVQLGVLVLSIIGIVNVAQHKQKELPLVGQFSKYFDKI